MHRITVVGLGPGPREYLTMSVIELMEKTQRLVLRTGKNDVAVYLTEKGIAYETFDMLHEQNSDFNSFNESVVDGLLVRAGKSGVVYAVFDPAFDETVAALTKRCGKVRVIPGVSLAATFVSALPGIQFPINIQEASGLSVHSLQEPLLVLEMGSRILAGECKLKMLLLYGDGYEILFFPPSQAVHRDYKRIPLYELDRQPKYDHTAAALLLPVPLKQHERYDFSDLVDILRTLRGNNGCPWDREQTHQSLRQYLIEEAYETAAAIDEEDWDHVANELGDVLLQVVFQADIGRQYGTFDLSDITTAICKKMISRHRHIFGKDTCRTAEEVSKNWEKIKREEFGICTMAESLLSIPRGMPPLMRAYKALGKVHEDGVKKDPGAVIGRVQQMCAEINLQQTSGGDMAEKIGDLLFACVEFAWTIGLQPETALASACERFIKSMIDVKHA